MKVLALLTAPVLIHMTDGSGRYRIEDLRPGTYTASYTLSGFSTVKREGPELAGQATDTLNIDLKVGNIPSVRSYRSMVLTVPGVRIQHPGFLTGDAPGSSRNLLSDN
jgi:hypothetical protein